MQILKHTFEIERYGVQDGEVVDLDPQLITCRFSLTVKALELFEEEYGKPVIGVLFGGKDGEVASTAFIQALAASCYFVIDNNELKQNQATKEAFKNLEIYSTLGNDLDFTTEIVGMAVTCIEERVKKSQQNNKANGKKPKN